jgi:membrane protein YdbS with pleckstrin-like domain
MLHLEDGEHIETIIRKHWLPFGLQAFVLLVVALAPLIALMVMPADTFNELTVYMSSPSLTIVFVFSLWLLVIWMLLFICWTNYYLDVWVVTSERIIDIDQQTLFHREVISARLEKIQDVHVEVGGILPTFFGYGKLILYTAGEDTNIIIENASRPYVAKEKLLAAQRAAVSKPATGML